MSGDLRFPHDLAAERAVLGAILLHNAAIDAAAAIVEPRQYFRDAHRILFSAMLEMRADGTAIDLITLKAKLNTADLERIGGPSYISALIDGVPLSTNIEAYAKIVREHAIRRSLIFAASQLSARAQDPNVDPGSTATAAVSALELLRDGGDAFAEPRIAEAVAREKAVREAKRRCDAEVRGPLVIPAPTTLRERLARPVRPTPWRIPRWQRAGSRVLLAAQYKAGKTTLRDNLVRALVDGGPFLDTHVTPIDGVVTVVDIEMEEGQTDEWLRAQRIRNDDHVVVVSLKGRVSSFDIIDPKVRAEWANWLLNHGSKYLMLDCLRPILDVLGLDENRDAGRFLVAFDALLHDAGITEAVLVHHFGHNGERARGDSRLLDWADCSWKLTKADDDPAGARFLSAYGRDVDVPEGQVSYEPDTRRLTFEGGSRQDAKSFDALGDIVAVLAAKGEPLTGRAVKRVMKAADSEYTAPMIDAALRSGVKTGALLGANGPRNSRLYRLPDSSVSVFQSVSKNSVNSSVQCSAPLRGQNTRTLETDGYERL